MKVGFLVLVLILEPWRPQAWGAWGVNLLTRWRLFLFARMPRVGAVLWLGVVGFPLLLMTGVQSGLGWLHLGALVPLLVLGLGIDLRGPLSHLRQGGMQIPPYSEPNQSVRAVLDEGILGSYQRFFAPLFWFFLLPGGWGPLLYCGTALLVEAEPDGLFYRRMQAGLDWTPVRLLALTFALVGDFEEALYAWRDPDRLFLSSQELLQAVVHGALGSGQANGGNGPFEALEADQLTSAEGLIWRAVVLWGVSAGLATALLGGR
ncbi:regulatory signaling modulator protein AmpE [Ferrovum myxofaciens]|uniref:regulatory signaling modulator protein AmpE n=1 Tax=Ferrovum myxofaciens TaxID=416213 RepID=UPI002353913B|nr:regulatory signaling modulator protein AmpE [Ferrovum myxofaciens]MBU6993563.1 regulatory signaling modulator protein AmpE [Ferrovum myxofaciens]